MTDGVRVEAWAKINLYLHVVGRRDDGYHRLDSLVAFAGIGDTLDARVSETLTLDVDGPTARLLPEGEENIVLTAARRLADHASRPATAALRLTKRLPVAAGIGGGSADAAATLRALARLWSLTVPDSDRHRLALGLGADVPVCLAGGSRHLSGIGESVAPGPALPPAWLVLVNPLQPCPTPAVFKARRGPFSSPAPLLSAPGDAQALARLLAERRNDLTEAAIERVPVIADILAALAACPGCLLARMSGSGATCFGLFATAESAQTAAAALATRHPDWWSAAAPLIATPNPD